MTPQMVELPKIPYKLFCGEFNITVIGNEGIYTWGSNYRNQFLNPDKENTFTPQKIELSDIIEQMRRRSYILVETRKALIRERKH